MTVARFFLMIGISALCYVEFFHHGSGAQPTTSLTSANIPESEIERNLCGPFSLSVICRMLGVNADLANIARLAGTTEKGTSFKGLANAADQLGLNAKGLRISPKQLLNWNTPLILHVSDDHFLVVESVIGENLRLIEKNREPYLMPMSELVKIWKGYVLAVSKPELSKKSEFSGPDIQIDELVYDWGVVNQETRVSHSFAVRNTGTEVLSIGAIKPGCNCSKAVISSTKIHPSHTAQLEVEYATTFTDWGEKMTTVEVQSNDPDEPVVLVTIKGTVVSNIPVRPQVIKLGNIVGNEKVVRKLEVYDWGIGQLKVKKVSTSSPQIVARLASQVQGQKAVIRVEVQPQIPRGDLKEQIFIDTNHPETPQISVYIRATVTGSIRVFPSRFFLGILQRGKPISQSVAVTQHGKQDLKITHVEANSTGMDVKFTVIEPGAKHLVELSFVAEANTEKIIRDIVRIHTNQTDLPIIEIPVYGIVQ